MIDPLQYQQAQSTHPYAHSCKVTQCTRKPS